MENNSLVWLCASYQFATTYSCSIPLSSQTSAQAMPGPGPATIRLALVRNSLELFEVKYVREILFPVIRSAEIKVQPPEKVAISNQVIRLYKSAEKISFLQESIGYREVAQANGLLKVYLKVPEPLLEAFTRVLEMVGYWGHADSLAYCLKVIQVEPDSRQCALPLSTLLSRNLSLGSIFSCFVTEFRDTKVEWEQILPDNSQKQTNVLRTEIFGWPLVYIQQHTGGKLLQFVPFNI